MLMRTGLQLKHSFERQMAAAESTALLFSLWVQKAMGGSLPS
jgi:hypothetical protein